MDFLYKMSDNQILATICLLFAVAVVMLLYFLGWVGKVVIDRWFKSVVDECKMHDGVYQSESMNAKLQKAKDYVNTNRL